MVFMRAIVKVVCVIVFSGAMGACGWGENSYEQCMVNQMKGQSQSMYAIVDKLCSRRFR
jgi:hypothetical protein